MKWYNEDHLKWVIEKINKRKHRPYYMANEELADDIFPGIQAEFPDAKMIKYGISQYITVTKRAENALIRDLEKDITKHFESISKLQSAIKRLTA